MLNQNDWLNLFADESRNEKGLGLSTEKIQELFEAQPSSRLTWKGEIYIKNKSEDAF
ncbi:hypothetical protein GMD78_07405 [Ornithinibacillus sp. L9]|uniref:Uncharacterized protein n=1 Tax=Ornithinibacillus caprae TaxID=2678566 RepID=A0A6N8FJR6_9BACI|nr:hypothetical protein [Ornithinibacillus caprae]MUK88217.1 hypothetical protein [Ornithinibacillus caprae]